VIKSILINEELKILWQMCEKAKSTVVILYINILRWPVMTKTVVNSSYTRKYVANTAFFWGENNSRVHITCVQKGKTYDN
jgi:hypothetical protein